MMNQEGNININKLFQKPDPGAWSLKQQQQQVGSSIFICHRVSTLRLSQSARSNVVKTPFARWSWYWRLLLEWPALSLSPSVPAATLRWLMATRPACSCLLPLVVLFSHHQVPDIPEATGTSLLFTPSKWPTVRQGHAALQRWRSRSHWWQNWTQSHPGRREKVSAVE